MKVGGGMLPVLPMEPMENQKIGCFGGKNANFEGGQNWLKSEQSERRFIKRGLN